MPLIVDVLLHHKTEQEYIFFIDTYIRNNAKVHQKAVARLESM